MEGRPGTSGGDGECRFWTFGWEWNIWTGSLGCQQMSLRAVIRVSVCQCGGPESIIWGLAGGGVLGKQGRRKRSSERNGRKRSKVRQRRGGGGEEKKRRGGEE